MRMEFYTKTYLILLYLHEASGNLNGVLAVGSGIDHLTYSQQRDDRCVVGEYLELSHSARHQDALNGSVVFNLLRGNNPQLQHKFNLQFDNLQFDNLCFRSCFEQFLGFLLRIFDGTHVQEGLFGQVVHFAVEDGVEALDGLLDRHHHTGQTREL